MNEDDQGYQQDSEGVEETRRVTPEEQACIAVVTALAAAVGGGTPDAIM